MRIWLVTIGEPWPTDASHVRLHRTGIIARHYARGGEEVVWFNETFDHNTRSQMRAHRPSGKIESRLEMVGMHGRGYRRSVSISRILHHGDIAADFRKQVEGRERPDVIVASLTPLELSREAVRHGRRNGIPVIVDIRDLWPEIWLGLAPPVVRPLARAILDPYFAMLAEIARDSSAICGISEEAVDWALAHGGRTRNAFDGALPLAYQPPELSPSELAEAERFWSARGIERDERLLTICFFGNLSARVELDTVIRMAQNAPPDLRKEVRIVFCGRGEVESRLSQAARQSEMIHFAGWVNAAQIEVLKRRSHMGLLPYPSDMDFVRSMPNKVFDYLSGGLPILTCLKGVTAQLIAREGCGWLYGNNDPQSLIRLLAMLAADRDAVARAAERARAASAQFAAADIYGRFRERLHAIIAVDGVRNVADKARM